MDKKEEQTEVSLPGAGGAEPTILEVLNRSVINECDSEVAAQHPPPQEVHQPHEDHATDVISPGGPNDTNQQEILASNTDPTPVTDLDQDDNENGNDRILELQSHLIAEDTTAGHSACAQVISELVADPASRPEDEVPSSAKDTISAECDIVPLDNTARLEVNTIRKLVDLSLPIIDTAKKRLSAVEELSNESESSYSDDTSKQTVISEPNQSEESRPWYQDDDLDPEDQRIIQEAVESILKDAKKQLVEEKPNSSPTEDSYNLATSAVDDLRPLHPPRLLLTEPSLESDLKEGVHETGQSVDVLASSDIFLGQANLDDIENSESDSGVTSPNETDSQLINEPTDTYKETADDIESFTSLTSPSDFLSLNSEVPSPSSGDQNQSTNNTITNSLESSSPSHEEKVNISESNEILASSVQSTIQSAIQPEADEGIIEDTSHLNNTEKVDLSLSKTEKTVLKLNFLQHPDENTNIFQKIEYEDNLSSENDSHPKSPQSPQSDISSLCSEAKKEYYQRLRDFLNNEEFNRPPVPLKTYQWEDLRRAKKQGGYPWTHLYKRPLVPGEDPEILVLRKSQERQKFSSESPRSVKKVVRIHEEVLVKETERYISDLSDNDTDEEIDDRPEDQREEDESSHQDSTTCSPPGDNFSVQSEPILSVASDDKSSKITRIKGILKRRLSLKHSKPGSAPESRAEEATPTARKRRFIGTRRIAKCCHPIMNKLKSMADKQLKRRNIKKVPLKDNEKIVLSEKQKILKLKASPKADHGQIPHFIEKQDSDDVLEILELEESPSKTRRVIYNNNDPSQQDSSILVPDEIIELPTSAKEVENDIQNTSEIIEKDEHGGPEDPSQSSTSKGNLKLNLDIIPKKLPRRQKEHVYEDIEDKGIEDEIDEILQEAVESASRISEQIQEEMQKVSPDKELNEAEKEVDKTVELKIVEDFETDEQPEAKDLELKSALKRESSPGADKRVTFSHTEDEAEPHREDIILPEEYRQPARYTDNHEYEPIGLPQDETQTQEPMDVEKESSPILTFKISEPSEHASDQKTSSLTSIEKELAIARGEEEDRISAVLEEQREIEERYFSSLPTTPRTDSRTDNEIHTSQVDSSAIEELPLKAENRKKSFMASAQDRSRRMTQNIRSQAGKIKTRIHGSKKVPSGSPKTKERKRFRKPDFSKIKMPEIKRPELPKFKTPEMPKFKSPEFKRPEFKRPEFTKFEKPIFTKPDLSRFKIPDSMTLKLRRTKSLRETEPTTSITETTPESAVTPETATTPKKRFEFNFGTYPRMLKKRKQKLSTIVIAKADDLPSTETPPSVESTTLPRQEGGPVSPRWNEKVSEVSYGDSESGKYQRYGSEVESLGRESSLERRMKEDIERSAREQEELEILQSIEQKQFADYDEENRAIHEISKIRESEFKKRRPMVHQDSDLVSEESKDVGWSEKDAIRNAMLRGTEDPDSEFLQRPEKYPSEEMEVASAVNMSHETQSTASSGNRHKGVIEEIDDDEFILRKRGISQDNIEIRQYISSAIREGLTTPINTLAQLGNKDSYYPDMDISNEQVNYGYDVPPPKPKRANKLLNDFDRARNTESRELSQDFEPERRGSFDDNTSLPHSSEGYFANIPPNRPTRRSRRKHYPRDEDHQVPSEQIPYLDDEEDNALFKKMNIDVYKHHQEYTPRKDYEEPDVEQIERFKAATPPKAPKRRKKQLRESVDKDSYANRFAGRSVSNSFLPSEERDEDFIVYRTQHEYIIPLAQAETFSTPTPAPRRSRSRSQSRITDDDRTSRGAESFASESIPLEENKFHIDMKESDGYATVRKEPPPRPPAPIRQRKASPLPDRHFSTMPHPKREVSSVERSKQSFQTMGPSRPTRRRSSASLGDSKKEVSSPDVTQYEELDIDDERNEQDRENRVESPRGDLHSGDVINKMKYRPLPPPPRPPRESRKKGRRDRSDQPDNKDDRDDGAERMTYDLQLNGDYNVEKQSEKCIEVEVSTQTDPLPDDFVCEEFEITDDMRVIEPRVGRTLQDVLKQDEDHTDHQEDDDSLSKSLQRFREASQRSYSERSRASTGDRSKVSHGSRPTTPSAILIERRVPTPIPNRDGETMLEASLLVMPVDGEDYTDDHMPKDDQSSVDEFIARITQEEEEERLTRDKFEHESPRESPATGAHELYSEEEQEDNEEEPPIAPPRKRSSVTADTSLPADRDTIPTRTGPVPATTDIEPLQQHEVERSSPFPTRLTLAELEVERLSVNELQASNIIVSQLQSSMLRTDELECRSSNITQPLEIPEGLIDEIVRRVRSAEREKESDTVTTQTTEQHSTELPESPPVASTTDSPPPRPPPPQVQIQGSQQPPVFPSEYMQYSIPPPSFYTLQDPSEVEHHHSPSHRRRRHHRRRDSSSEEDSHREHRRSRHSTRSPEPTIGQLGGQLLQACGSSVMQTVNHIVNILRANAKEGNDRNISTAIVLVILVTIGFLLLGISGNKNIHHHHWDYFNPPDHKGRE